MLDLGLCWTAAPGLSGRLLSCCSCCGLVGCGIADIMEHHESSKVSNWSEVNNADRSASAGNTLSCSLCVADGKGRRCRRQQRTLDRHLSALNSTSASSEQTLIGSPQRIAADIHSRMADTHIPRSFPGDIHQLPDVSRLFLIVDVCHNMIVVMPAKVENWLTDGKI